MSQGSDEIVDLVFALGGRVVAEDYADRLWRALQAVLPWLEEDPLAAVHPLAGTSAGQGERYLSKHARLLLRLSAGRVEAARALCGRRLDLGGEVAVGAATVRALMPSAVLHSPLVQLGTTDESAFSAECRRLLDGLGVGGHMVSGQARSLQAGARQLAGFSLMLHGLESEASLRVQRAGLGADRKHGCGVFVPHKSVAPVGT